MSIAHMKQQHMRIHYSGVARMDSSGQEKPTIYGNAAQEHKTKGRVSRRNCRLSRDELSIYIYIGCGNGAGFAMISFVFVAVV